MADPVRLFVKGPGNNEDWSEWGQHENSYVPPVRIVDYPNSFKIPAYDTEERTYNLDGSIDTKIYKLDGETVATLQYTYTDGILVSKQVI